MAYQTMKQACERHCSEYNLLQNDLQGPVEDAVNSKPNNKNFGFTWKGNEMELIVSVADNGLHVGSEYWWVQSRH